MCSAIFYSTVLLQGVYAIDSLISGRLKIMYKSVHRSAAYNIKYRKHCNDWLIMDLLNKLWYVYPCALVSSNWYTTKCLLNESRNILLSRKSAKYGTVHILWDEKNGCLWTVVIYIWMLTAFLEVYAVNCYYGSWEGAWVKSTVFTFKLKKEKQNKAKLTSNGEDSEK